MAKKGNLELTDELTLRAHARNIQELTEKHAHEVSGECVKSLYYRILEDLGSSSKVSDYFLIFVPREVERRIQESEIE